MKKEFKKIHNKKLRVIYIIDQDTFSIREELLKYFLDALSAYPHIKISVIDTEFIEDVMYFTIKVFSPSVMKICIDFAELNYARDLMENAEKKS